MVEFQRPEDIRLSYPDRIRELADGGRWNTIAGQPTDDSEMALMLARMLAEQGKYVAEEARKAYRFWLDSPPSTVEIPFTSVFAVDPISTAKLTER
jgi:ADP-ribosylglycohydrolase